MCCSALDLALLVVSCHGPTDVGCATKSGERQINKRQSSETNIPPMKTAQLLALFIAFSTSMHAKSIENIANEIAVIPRNEISADDLPKGLEEEVLEVLRQRNDTSTLIHLNDQETISEWVQQYKAIQGKSFIMNLDLKRRISAPYIIDELSPLLYVDDDLAVRSYNDEGGNIDHGLSHSVALGIASIVAKSPQFTEDVHSSAEGVLDSIRGSDSLILTIRKWWEVNELALRAENFDDVQPIAEIKVDDPTEEVVAKIPPTPEVETVAQESTAPEPAIEEIPKVVIVETSEDPAEQPSQWWLWLIGALVVLGGLVIVARRKS